MPEKTVTGAGVTVETVVKKLVLVYSTVLVATTTVDTNGEAVIVIVVVNGPSTPSLLAKARGRF